MYTQTASHDHHTPTGGNVGHILLIIKILEQCI